MPQLGHVVRNPKSVTHRAQIGPHADEGLIRRAAPIPCKKLGQKGHVRMRRVALRARPLGPSPGEKRAVGRRQRQSGFLFEF
jgi:hypothetical protein